MPQVIEFESLGSADLIVDAIYGGKDSRLASDPISRLLPGCGNMGGFRLAGKGQDKQFVALFTTGQEKDWPDRIDLNTGQFTYYGDNRTSGHKTPLGGNRVLRRVFDLLHGSPPQRELIPPFFVSPWILGLEQRQIALREPPVRSRWDVRRQRQRWS
jgi:Restriction endonuclease AspBHI N-terminal